MDDVCNYNSQWLAPLWEGERTKGREIILSSLGNRLLVLVKGA